MLRVEIFRTGRVLILALVLTLTGVAFSPNAWAIDAQGLFQRAKDSVVAVIEVDKEGKPRKYGSGFLMRRGDMVATNQHVIDGAEFIKVKLPNGRVVDVDQVRAESKEHDLAVLVIPSGGEGLELASEEPQVGEEILAIGNPKGLDRTLSTGVVSGIRHRGNTKFYQITAPISPGSSGGPILNAQGEVIALATFYALDGQNLNFAVPASYIMELLGMKRGSSGRKHFSNKSKITIEKGKGGILLKQK